MVDMTKKSCFTCKNGEIDGGYSGSYDEPGYPPFLEDCKVVEVPEDYFDGKTEEQLAETCGHYDPIMVKKCCECGKIINQPYYLWEHWAALMDLLPMCSEECVEKAVAKFESFFKDENRNE